MKCLKLARTLIVVVIKYIAKLQMEKTLRESDKIYIIDVRYVSYISVNIV